MKHHCLLQFAQCMACGTYWPCVESRFPWFSLFAKILATLAGERNSIAACTLDGARGPNFRTYGLALADRPPRQAMAFLRAVRDQPIPAAGQRVTIALQSEGTATESVHLGARGTASRQARPLLEEAACWSVDLTGLWRTSPA